MAHKNVKFNILITLYFMSWAWDLQNSWRSDIVELRCTVNKFRSEVQVFVNSISMFVLLISNSFLIFFFESFFEGGILCHHPCSSIIIQIYISKFTDAADFKTNSIICQIDEGNNPNMFYHVTSWNGILSNWIIFV